MSIISRLALSVAVLLAPLLAAADPPARVGRLSLLEGNVTFRTDRQDTGAPATLNWPISSGAILDTDGSGRAEIWVGSSTFRLGSSSRAEFSTVDEHRVALQVAQGTLAVTVRDREQADGIDISTPAAQIHFGAPGRYRIDVDETNGNTQVSSRDGVAYVYRPGGELSVSSGQKAVAYAAGGWFVAESRPDGFDDWADARDSMSNAPTARRYVSPHMTGYEDLDRYGNWSASSEYGEVWYPSAIPVGWAPYRYGRWAWVPPWGWTWIDAAPWGFAPFHYGRWVLIGGQWAWVPGAYTPRPVYAPALVAWVGNPGWSVGFSFGASPAVGWFPLGPREVFVPAYRCSPTYVRQVNVTSVTNVTVIEQVVAGRQKPAFMHRSLPQAVTVVPARVVQTGSPITQTAWRQPERHELAQAPIAARAPGTTWLPPAATALRPRLEHAPSNRLAPLAHPENPLSRQAVSANNSPVPSAPIQPQRFEAERQAARQIAPVAPVQAPHDGETSTAPNRRFSAPIERAPALPAPAPAVGPTPNKEREFRPRHLGPEPTMESRTVVQPPGQPQPTAPPASVGTISRAVPEVPRTEVPMPRHENRHPERPSFERPAPERQIAPPPTVQIQPQVQTPPRHWAPAAMQAPAVREAIQQPPASIPRSEGRPATANEQHEHRHERGKAPNAPQ